MTMRSALALWLVTGCGRIHFDARSDGRSGDDGVVVDTLADATLACGGAAAATCPPATAYPITTGGHVHVAGETGGFGDGRSGSCGGAGAAEFVVQLDIASFGFYNLSTAGSTFDTVIYVLDGDCAGAELDCTDAVTGSAGETLMLGLAHAGTFYVIVDGKPATCGHVELDVQG